ncbi:Thiosulfate sulfurtransferase, rhodanese [hydrothermal vent metagenome]|uniref:Thiosulfate sulfurtransferase, rhodanese n=1 Tax=hydrothermal vent metagenome TaxID=652676 RepID=A0A1W1CKF0_9ZZZZ
MKKPLLIFALLFTALYVQAASLRIEASTFNKEKLNYTLLDTRAKDVYNKGHIIGALNFPIGLTYANMQLNGKLTDPFTMQKIVQNLGLNADDKLVIYDNGSFFDAARLFWALEVYGFKDVKLLNAGYKQWSNKKFETSIQTPTVSKSDYVTIINNNRLATKFTTQIATRNPNQIIIDARPDKAYEGHISSAKRKGHIPKALNIPASHNIDTDNKGTTLKDLSQLKDLYKGIDKKKKIILYCAIGKISATNYFALRELGYNVSNYDASWREWGNDLRLPVINLQETK